MRQLLTEWLDDDKYYEALENIYDNDKDELVDFAIDNNVLDIGYIKEAIGEIDNEAIQQDIANYLADIGINSIDKLNSDGIKQLIFDLDLGDLVNKYIRELCDTYWDMRYPIIDEWLDYYQTDIEEYM